MTDDGTAARHAGSTRAFLALLERNVSTKIVLSAWCPTMDIVVLVTADQQLQSFRLNWERLWSKQPASSITSIQWRPDGKQIAYGDEEGNVVILAAEDGAEVERRRVFCSGANNGNSRGHASDEESTARDGLCGYQAVVGLSWAVCGIDASDGRPPRSTRLLGHHSHEQGFGACSGTNASSHTYCTPASHNGLEVRSAWEARLARRGRGEDAALRMLCAVSANGDGVVCGEGLLPMLAFRTFDRQHDRFVGDDSGTIVGMDVVTRAGRRAHTHETISLRMSPTAGQMWVGWRNGSGLHLARMDTSIVGRHASMIRSVGGLLSDTLKDVGLMYAVTGNIAAHVAEVEAAREEHLDNLRSILGGTRDPEKDIYDFLVRGAYSMELKAFVGREGVLKTAARKVDSAMACMYHDIVYHLQPCLERIGFRLGDLRGYSLTPDGARVLGLRPEAVGAAERWALDFVALTEQVRELVLKASSGYRNLYALLSMLQHREMGEKYPSPPKSAVEEVEQLITARYYSAELAAVISGISGETAGSPGAGEARNVPEDGAGAVDEKCGSPDERLLAAVFDSAAGPLAPDGGSSSFHRPRDVSEGDKCSMNVERITSYDRSAAYLAGEEREEAAALEYLTLGLDLWLEGGTSMDQVDALLERKSAQLAHWSEDSGLASPSSLDVFKSLLLGIVACPARALSSHARTTSYWNILSTGLRTSGACGSGGVSKGTGQTTIAAAAADTVDGLSVAVDPFSMELDQNENLHVIAALGASFVHVAVSPNEDALADVHAGSVPGGLHVASCAMHGKADALILTAVPSDSLDSSTTTVSALSAGSAGQTLGGSLIAIVPLGDNTCPLHIKRTFLQGPIDGLIKGVGEMNASRCRIRHVPGLEIVAPFAASATRGVALAVFSPLNSITIYDLEDDEEEEEVENSGSEDGSYDENVELTED